MSKPTISKPSKKKVSTRSKSMLGEPEQQIKSKNLDRPVSGVRKRINFRVAPEKKTEILVTAATTGLSIGDMFMEAYEFWKKNKLN